MKKLLVTCFLSFLLMGSAFAHDLEHKELDDWYANLKQPDNPEYSCCGEADAYWCDEEHVIAGKNFCVITDDRDDFASGSLHVARTHIPLGTLIEIPDKKIKYDQGNPTGHSIVFVHVPYPINGGLNNISVYCFVRGAGG